MLLPKDSVFPITAPRWEIGGKVFRACMFYYDSVNYPGIAYLALLVKRSEGVWDAIYKSDVYWLNVQNELGAEMIIKSLIPRINGYIRTELGLPELTFNEEMNERLNSAVKVVGNMLVLEK